MKNKKKCFVIMPFSKTKSCTEQEWTGIFKGIIKPAVEESGLVYECERSVAERQNIVKGILEALNKANVVIADLTDNNPNVFYELGVRHTLTNRTILIAQGEKYIPFDLRPYPVAFYSKSLTNIEEFKSDIKKKLQDIETNPERSDNPVADFLQLKNIDIVTYEKSANLKKLTALISEISYNITSINIILTQIEKNKETRQKNKNKWSYLHQRFVNTCLELFLSTSYIIPPQKLLENMRLSNDFLKVFNANLAVWPNNAKQVEEKLINNLPTLEVILTALLKGIGILRVDYKNDNYQEPKEPIILLASPEHEEYLKIV